MKKLEVKFYELLKAFSKNAEDLGMADWAIIQALRLAAKNDLDHVPMPHRSLVAEGLPVVCGLHHAFGHQWEGMKRFIDQAEEHNRPHRTVLQDILRFANGKRTDVNGADIPFLVPDDLE